MKIIHCDGFFCIAEVFYLFLSRREEDDEEEGERDLYRDKEDDDEEEDEEYLLFLCFFDFFFLLLFPPGFSSRSSIFSFLGVPVATSGCTGAMPIWSISG